MNENETVLYKKAFQNILESVENEMPISLKFQVEENRYTRNFLPQERLILLGGGHISQPLCTFASALGFKVTIVDDRPTYANTLRFPEAETVICDSFRRSIKELKIKSSDYVAVITRGHRSDADCIREILAGTKPYYLGMIGSVRRGIELLNILEEEGFSREDLDEIHTPIGLPLNALTIQEIAMSIVAELVQHRRKDFIRRSKNKILITEDIDIELLKFIAEEERPKAVLIVYETSGSTPVKSGAYMAVTQEMNIKGTIGGGCSENEVLHEARKLIGTGESRNVTIDMSNDVAEEEGMVCGGRMKVWISDIVDDR